MAEKATWQPKSRSADYYFALQSGEEHRNLRHSPCQIKLVEHPGERAYLQYIEDVSKNQPRGLKGRKVKPKVVVHHENQDNPRPMLSEAL